MKKLCALLCLTAAASSFAAPTVSSTTKASNDFGLELYLKLQQDKKNENVFFSPVSASQAMTLLLAGSNGNTYSELATGLKLGKEKNISTILASSSEDLKALTQNSDPKKGIVLEIANSVWGDSRSRFTFNPSYLKNVKNHLNAEAQSLDFKNASSADVINKWASDKTKGKIPKVTSPDALSGMVAMLMNATYFKGDWTLPFDAHDTQEKGFKGLKSTLKVKMMNNGYSGKHLRYYETKAYQAVELGYGQWVNEGYSASMIVIHPKDYESFTKNLNVSSLQDIVEKTQGSKGERVSLSLPKFSFSAEYNLIPAIQSMGIKEVFTSDADLSNLSQGAFAVSLIKQNTFVAVDEKGTEAAAVTSVGIEATSVPRPANKIMNVDSPFVVIIKSNTTGAILFVGSIVDPSVK